MVTAAPPALWPHQERAIRFIKQTGNALIAGEVGVGKTCIALVAVRGRRRILVLTPVSAFGVWPKEVARLGLPHRVVLLNKGTSEQRAKTLHEAAQSEEPLIVVSNYEGVWRPPLLKAVEAWRPDCLIADEVSRISYRTSIQSKQVYRLAQIHGSVKQVIGLSGTVATKGREQLFGIFRAIDPLLFGTNWKSFSQRYLIEVNMGDYLKVVGYRNTADMDQRFAQRAHQIAQSEALPWLPGQRDEFVQVELEPASRRRYNQFARDAVTKLEGINPDTGRQYEGTVLARIALTTLLRLQQMTSGFVSTEENGELVVSDEKLRVCADLVRELRDSDRSVVVFFRFTLDGKRLQERLQHDLHERVTVLRGGVTGHERQQILDRFLAKQDRVILLQEHVAIGINELVAASDAIYYSVSYSLEDMVQSKGRLHRPGQLQPVTYWHLVGKNTVDEELYQVLQSNCDVASSFLSLDFVKGFLTHGTA